MSLTRRVQIINSNTYFFVLPIVKFYFFLLLYYYVYILRQGKALLAHKANDCMFFD